MRTFKGNKSAGFAVVEALLIIVILAGIVGIGVYIMHQRQTTKTTASGATSQTQAPAGTTSSIDQLTQQDAQTEAGTDSQADNQMQQDATSANSATSNVGGAYNEANL